MSITLSAPPNSFVQFTVSDMIQPCEFPGIQLCLPVYEDDDVSFQFIVTADTESEADDLCDLANTKIKVGISEDCDDGFLLQFSEKPERYRISPTKILYNWGHGLPAFATVISCGECFHIRIVVDNLYIFCSNCFQRISEICHTSVIEYSNEDNYAGFNYCNSEVEETYIPGGTGPGPGDRCYDPTIIQFSNISTLAIPYTTALFDKYGSAPSVKAWIFDEHSVLVDMGVRITFDAYPPSEINIDFGGPASGVIVIR